MPSPLEPGDLKRRILDASIELIRTDGLSALSMREVARRAGVSHQAPYHYFEDREGVLASLATEGFRALADALSAPREEATSLEDRAKRAGIAYVTFALSHPAHFRIMFRPELVDLTRYPELQDESLRALAELRALVDSIFDALAPGLRGTRETWTTIHWSLVHGLACLLLDGPLAATADDPAAQKAHVADVLEAFASVLVGTRPAITKPKTKKRARRR